LVDAEHLRSQAYTQLSGGEQQRVQLARIFAQVWEMQPDKANVLILDEPTSALDFSHQHLILQALRKKADEGCGVLLALHDLNLAAAFADQVLLMDNGCLRAQGCVDEILQPPLLSEVFGLPFHRMIHPSSGKPLLVY
jgi:iron complex transport system ATP-binding protein